MLHYAGVMLDSFSAYYANNNYYYAGIFASLVIIWPKLICTYL